MADLLSMIIQFLNINCSFIECYQNNPLEAVFYLVFFPTVFIILFIYIISNVLVKGDGVKGPQGLRILVSVAIYMFIVIGGWYSLFVVVSKIWWLVIILLAGFWIFVRHYFGGSSKGSGGMPSAIITGIKKELSEKMLDKFLEKARLQSKGRRIDRETKSTINKIIDKRNIKGINSLTEPELLIYLSVHGVDVKSKDDMQKALRSERESDKSRD